MHNIATSSLPYILFVIKEFILTQGNKYTTIITTHRLYILYLIWYYIHIIIMNISWEVYRQSLHHACEYCSPVQMVGRSYFIFIFIWKTSYYRNVWNVLKRTLFFWFREKLTKNSRMSRASSCSWLRLSAYVTRSFENNFFCMTWACCK